MSDALKKLKDLGAQKIYEDTHIPIGHVQAILDENYEELTRIQFLGFLSILERDYDLDLSGERAAAIAYYDEKNSEESLADDGIFVVPTKAKNLTPLYIIIALVIFLGALYYTLDIADQTNTAYNNTTQTQPESNTKTVTVDINKSSIPVVHESEEQPEEENITVKTEVAVPVKAEPLEILPRSRVWLGYIDVATNKKYQKTFADELDLDGDKEWLLIFGHGYVDVIAGGEKVHFSDKNTLRLHYKDGMLEKISLDEFKRLNRGRKW